MTDRIGDGLMIDEGSLSQVCTSFHYDTSEQSRGDM